MIQTASLETISIRFRFRGFLLCSKSLVCFNHLLFCPLCLISTLIWSCCLPELFPPPPSPALWSFVTSSPDCTLEHSSSRSVSPPSVRSIISSCRHRVHSPSASPSPLSSHLEPHPASFFSPLLYLCGFLIIQLGFFPFRRLVEAILQLIKTGRGGNLRNVLFPLPCTDYIRGAR